MLSKVRPLLMLFGGTFGSALFSMGAQLILARTLDVAEFGLLAALLAAVNLLSPVAGFGSCGIVLQSMRFIRPSYSASGYIRMD